MTDISFEEKVKKAQELLEKLSDKDITLKDSMQIYKEGINVIKEAQKLLEEAKIEFETISKNEK